MTGESLPVVSPAGESAGERAVWGVLLAAGASARFGDRNKLLERIDGDPIVRHAATPLLGGQLVDAVAVLGHGAGRVREALADLAIRAHENPDYESGLSTSVRAGVEYADARGADAVVVALGDMPSVSPQTVRQLVTTYEASSYTALAAACEGERGNPVLFDDGHFDALRSLSGDVGGRDVLLGAANGALVETHDPGVLRDVDTPEDVSESADRASTHGTDWRE